MTNNDNLQREVRKVLDEFMAAKPDAETLAREGFEIVCDRTNNDEKSMAAGKLNATLRFDITLCTALFGRTAGELRAMGYLKDSTVPDCATLGPNGFTWIELDFTLTPGEFRRVDQEDS